MAKLPEVKVGDKYGSRTVIGVPFRTKRFDLSRVVWATYCVCQCKCGKIQCLHVADLRSSGECIACGNSAERKKSHGGCGTQLHKKWRGMLRRCYNQNDQRYADYGGRGILVCDEWRHDFAAFRSWSEANGFSPELQIDRIDNDKGYSPENCRWITPVGNANNKRCNVVLTAFGETKTAAQWARDRRCAVDGKVLRSRIASGWNHEDAITANPLSGSQCRYHSFAGS